MEDSARERAAMVEYLRYHDNELSLQLKEVAFLPGTDLDAAWAGLYDQIADAWKHSLRRKAQYLAWRREREPDYQPPDEPDPKAWENLSDEQKLDRLRARRDLARLADRLQHLPPNQQRIMRYVQRQQERLHRISGRLRAIGARGDEQTRELADTLAEGLDIVEVTILTLATGGAFLELFDDEPL